MEGEKSDASVSYNGTTATVTLTGHGYSTGDVVFISGVPATQNQSTDLNFLNGNFVITRISANEFTYTPFTTGGSITLRDITLNRGLSVHNTYSRYDEKGQLIMRADPSAISSSFPKDESQWPEDIMGYAGGVTDYSTNQDFAYLDDNDGLVQRWRYYTSSDSDTLATETAPGRAMGQLRELSVQRGDGGSSGDSSRVVTETFKYIHHNVGSIDVYPIGEDTRYENTNQTGARTTSYAYTWYSGTARMQQVTTTLPTVSTSKNGSGSAQQTKVFYDTDGQPIWTDDADGFINYTQYDPATGAVVRKVEDVDTTRDANSDGSDSEQALPTFSDLPSSWSSTSGTHHNRLTLTQLDDQGMGRPRRVAVAQSLADANNDNLPDDEKVTYWVYNDAGHEVRMYPGWTGTTTTGPITIGREYRPVANASSGQRTLYYEVLTSSATPTTDAFGSPNGAETIATGNIQSLSRSLTNDGGLTTDQLDYTTLTSPTSVTYSQATAVLGVAGTNYVASYTHYDDRGRPVQKITGNGTVYWTVYDEMGRVASEWIGTNSTGATPTNPSNNATSPNNMKMVREYVYDQNQPGGIGDGTVTEVIEHSTASSADDRITRNYFDWRDRLVSTKLGSTGTLSSESETVQRQVSYNVYNNLNELV